MEFHKHTFISNVHYLDTKRASQRGASAKQSEGRLK